MSKLPFDEVKKQPVRLLEGPRPNVLMYDQKERKASPSVLASLLKLPRRRRQGARTNSAGTAYTGGYGTSPGYP